MKISLFKFQISNKYSLTLDIRHWKFSEGFTLIELLIVIAIIGILSSLVMANLMGVRERARDAQRKSDIQQIRTALEMYRADLDQYPPPFSCGSALVGGSPAKTYMAKVPCDPLSTSTPFNYVPSGSPPNGYTISGCIENGNDKDRKITTSLPSGLSCSGISSSGKYYVETNP